MEKCELLFFSIKKKKVLLIILEHKLFATVAIFNTIPSNCTTVTFKLTQLALICCLLQ